MKTNRRILFLIFVFLVLAPAGILLYGAWKLGAGDWTLLASIVSIIIGVAALLVALSRSEVKKANPANRRIGFLLYLWLGFAAVALLFYALSVTGVGEWATLVSMAAMALFVLALPVWFIIQPDLAMTSINALTGNVNAPDDWKALSPLRRALVYLGTLICLAVGILLLLAVFSRLSSG